MAEGRMRGGFTQQPLLTGDSGTAAPHQSASRTASHEREDILFSQKDKPRLPIFSSAGGV